VRDISAVVAAEDVDIISMETFTDKHNNKADFRIKIEVNGIDSLGRVLTKIQQIANIIEVYRVNS
jgi:GTP pyrophosphokinase